MKIVDIRTIPLSYRCEPPYGSAGGMQARRGGLLVEIETDERVIGIGEAGVGGGATRGRHRKAAAADADRRGPAADRRRCGRRCSRAPASSAAAASS